MKKLLVLFCAACICLLPAIALAGNPNPKLYLEIWSFSAKQTLLPTTPAYICTHPGRPLSGTLACWEPDVLSHIYVAVHIGGLVNICPNQPGTSQCDAFGGFLGLPFGINEVSDIALTFMNWNACNGFGKGPSLAGEPLACLASSSELCHDWMDHIGYLYYRNIDDTQVADLTIVKSLDTPEGGPWVINCSSTYDEGTTVGGGARYGGTELTCAGNEPTSVENTTWGKIKGLYR
ncbi:MAG: hypothetical protein NTX17_10110 [Candidatus Eisenbacteria bacterium]|nr:hypothetical protein [Candidatus Eisenbacteria bacterium]